VLRRLAWLAMLLLAARASAQSDDGDAALRRPERLTIGSEDHFLGQYGPDQALYFVSNREARKEILVQRGEGRADAVFDEGADVTWPRVSPDGKHLLYVSFAQRAAGQLCVRALPGGELRRCFDQVHAAIQAEWLSASQILLVGRSSIDGDLQLFKVDVAEQLSGRLWVERNWTHPAVSPDGRWLVYVPLDRVTPRVGPGFAARTAPRLEALRLDQPGEPQPLAFDLPGMTGQPVFARDGRALYFVQFFTDSNHDGLIDANDNGVLFRVPFAPEASDAPAQAAAALPTQITDSGWNCQYPAPSDAQLVVTCARRRKLDVYALPLDGEVPSEWSRERLRLELGLGGRQAEQLLLYRHALARAEEPRRKRLMMMRLMMVHLGAEEFDAAEFYAKKVLALREKETRGIGQPLLALIGHRRARAAAEQGRTVDTFGEDTKARLEVLVDGPKDSPAALVLNRIVASEIAETMGDLATARQVFESAVVDGETPRSVVEMYHARADSLYRALGERDALVTVCRRLAGLEGLPPEARLDYARAAVRAQVRGRGYDEADALLAEERARQDTSDELAFALDLGRMLLSIRDGRPDRERNARLLALYDAQPRPDRKRAIVLEVLPRAAALGADGTIERLSERYLDDVAPGTAERRRAEGLYRRAILGRAYRRLSRQREAEAQQDFEAVFRRTGALEALVGTLDARLKAGQPDATILAELAPLGDAAAAQFMKAYLGARALPKLTGEPATVAAERVLALLREVWPALRDRGAARALFGAVELQQYLNTGMAAHAESANTNLMLAVELSRGDPRHRAKVLTQLGLLHSHVGNYRIALGHLEEREKLPLHDDVEALLVRLLKSRALLRAQRLEDGAQAAEEALALVERGPELAPYLVLALDRAALASFSSGRFERAWELYGRELPLLAAGQQREALRNRFVVRLARAAAGIAGAHARDALGELGAFESWLDDRAQLAALTVEHLDAQHTERFYRVTIAGLRAHAHRVLGEREAVQRALLAQRSLLSERASESARDEDLRAQMLLEARIAENAGQLGKPSQVADALSAAFRHGDELARHLGTAVDLDSLRLVWLAAQLQVQGRTPEGFDVAPRLRATARALEGEPAPQVRVYQRWLALYLAMLDRKGS
jgi:hypothetical protein